MTNTDDYRDTAARALALCAAHDPWFPQPNALTVQAWAERIAEYQLTAIDTLDGVRIAYRDHGSGFRPLPHDIVQAARRARSERAQRESAAQRRDREDRQDARLAARNVAALTNGSGRSIE